MMAPVDVAERGRTTVTDALVDAVPAAFWAAAGCEVRKAPGDADWTVQTGDLVGVSRVTTPAGEVTLRVRPKLDTADVFFLADYAYDQRHEPLRALPFDQVEMEALLRDPSACLLAWHARSIRQFAARWLRRDYRRVDQVLDGKVKGRPLIGRYVAQHLAVGDAASIPCRVQERTQDTANNRLLKAGLRYVLAASHALPVPAARKAVMREAKTALPLFAQVSDINVSPSDIRAASSRGPLRHYAGVLAATTALLEGQLMGTELGSAASTTSFMWHMPTLFQEALRGVIDSTDGLVLSSSVGKAVVRDAAGKRVRTSKVDPDLVLRVDGASTLLLDTKYKDALPSDHEVDDELTLVADRRRIKVSRADIYQIVAYTHHEEWPGATGGLLYPTVLAPGDRLPEPLRVDGFGEPVWLLFVDVGPRAGANLPQFIEMLRYFADERRAAAC